LLAVLWRFDGFLANLRGIETAVVTETGGVITYEFLANLRGIETLLKINQVLELFRF